MAQLSSGEGALDEYRRKYDGYANEGGDTKICNREFPSLRMNLATCYPPSASTSTSVSAKVRAGLLPGQRAR